MQTHFSLVQLADPEVREVEKILRSCVHCGFCTATCPTYTLLGDELDSPRGRIYQIKDMLEQTRPASAKIVKHLDRCLSCLSCMTTCPSGVHYMHLVDHARAHVEETYRRPLVDRLLRALLIFLIPHPKRFRLALRASALARPFAGLMPKRLSSMLSLAPASLPKSTQPSGPGLYPAEGPRRGRVALLIGCVQQVLSPAINEATIRLLNRTGLEVVVSKDGSCCGSLVHHMGKIEESHASARANIRAWIKEVEGEGLDAIVVNASGCGTTVKDYGYMLREEPEIAEDAARISALTRDISEVVEHFGLPAPVLAANNMRVTYHAACSLQHGQKITSGPAELLKQAGFAVKTPAEAHLCCGSAGTYNMLQPDLSEKLKQRKLDNLRRTDPHVVATGNIGCITQLAEDEDLPVVHTVELLDWATGGPKPAGMDQV